MRWKAVERRRREMGVEVRLKIARFPEQGKELLIAEGNRKHSCRLLSECNAVNVGCTGTARPEIDAKTMLFRVRRPSFPFTVIVG